MSEKSLRHGNELTCINGILSMRQLLRKLPLKVAFFAYLY